MSKIEMLSRRQLVQACTAAGSIIATNACTQQAPTSEKNISPLIIDTHVHFYDPTKKGGIAWPKPSQKIYGKKYPEQLNAAAGEGTVSGSIVVESSPSFRDNIWIAELAEKESSVLGAVINLSSDTEGFDKHFNGLVRRRSVVGARLRPYNNHDVSSAKMRRYFELLADNNCTFEMKVTPQKDNDAFFSVAKDHPNLICIIVHNGHLKIDGNEPPEEWKDQILRLAELPNVRIKVTTLMQFAILRPRPISLDYYLPLLDFIWQTFGEDRCIYGSNWPTSELVHTYRENLNILFQYMENKPIARRKYFYQNALRTYNINI